MSCLAREHELSEPVENDLSADTSGPNADAPSFRVIIGRLRLAYKPDLETPSWSHILEIGYAFSAAIQANFTTGCERRTPTLFFGCPSPF